MVDSRPTAYLPFALPSGSGPISMLDGDCLVAATFVIIALAGWIPSGMGRPALLLQVIYRMAFGALTHGLIDGHFARSYRRLLPRQDRR